MTAKNYEAIALSHRRELHQTPEPSFREFKTNLYLKNILKEFSSFKLHHYSETGIVAEYRGAAAEKFLGFRADMDGLPLSEQTDLPYSSQNEGFMHACGHDLHMAILLTLAEYINDLKPEKNIILIFQPAEEGLGGAVRMIEEGLLRNFELAELFALHNTMDLPVGTIALNDNRMFAGTVEYRITLKGTGGHAAFYHVLNDLNVAASFLVMMLNTISSRFIDPAHEAIISLGHMAGEGGPAANILPQNFTMHGTARSYYGEDLELIKKKIDDMTRGVAMAYGISYDIEIISEYIPVINNKQAADRIRKLNGKNGLYVIDSEAKMTGEDFGFLIKDIPGAIFWLGVAAENDSENQSLHNPAYAPNEKGIIYGFNVLKDLIK